MRRAFGIVIAFCLGFPGAGIASQHQTPEPPNSTGQDSASGAPQTKQQIEPRTESKKKADVGSARVKAGGHAGKLTPAPAAESAPRKIVVREGGVDEPSTQIVTGMTPGEANRQRQNAEQLLRSTGETLERLAPRTLDAERQETVSQIHNYVEDARSALKEGDISRGHTLAVKAGLLAEDLEKH